MTNQEFQQELREIARSLSNLSQYPQWQQVCSSASEAGESTLEEALGAIERATYEVEPVYIPTIEEIFEC